MASTAPARTVPVAFEGICVSLGGRRVLSGIDLELGEGELLGLIGPNGAGKSTLLRVASGVLEPEAGCVSIEGDPLTSISRRDVARKIAVVQQLPEAPAAMRVAELVLLGRTPHLGLLARESARDYAIARRALQQAGCEDLADRTLGTLSGGQRRRAFIARALAQEPSILLLDEPTANLDPQAQAELCALLRSLVAEGIAVMVVLHDLMLAATYCDRIALMQRGEVVALGAPAEVLRVETVQRVYGNLVTVVPHPESGLPLVVPALAPSTIKQVTESTDA